MIIKPFEGRKTEIALLRSMSRQRERSAAQLQLVDAELRKIEAGHEGERNAAYFLDDLVRTSSGSRAMLHDIRLEVGGRTAQIDHLLINRRKEFFVFETKNISGVLSCNDEGEWAVHFGKQWTPIASPVEQAKRHTSVLETWLKEMDVDCHPPVAVVLVPPTARLGRSRDKDGGVPVVKSDMLARWYERRPDPKMLSMLSRWVWSPDKLKIVADKLVESHRPVSYDWERRFPAATATSHLEPVVDSTKPVVLDPQSSTRCSTLRPDTRDAACTETSHEKHSARSVISPVPETPRDRRVVILTADGEVVALQTSAGDFALRHAAGEMLQKRVESAARGRGRWNPRFRNWVVDQQQLDLVIEAMTHG